MCSLDFMNPAGRNVCALPHCPGTNSVRHSVDWITRDSERATGHLESRRSSPAYGVAG